MAPLRTVPEPDTLPLPPNPPSSDLGSASSPARYTPDSFADDENEDTGHDALDDIEAEDGYELQQFKSQDNGAADPEDETIEHGDAEASLLSGRKKRRRHSSVRSFQLYTPDEELAVRRKLDVRLVLFVALLYMMSFLDRSNIGNAKVAGLKGDLYLTDAQFEWLLTAFYISYIVFEWMTLCYKIFPPHIYISCCVFAWGVIASLQSVVTSFPLLLVLRALLGIGEAAFVGIPFYLSFFYKREELALRTGLFVSAAPLATTFAGSLAWLIVRFGDNTGIASWRLLFLVEGFPACLVAIFAWYWIPDSPSTTHWLTRRERKIATLRMRHDEVVAAQDLGTLSSEKRLPRHKQRFRWDEVRRTLTDPVSYLTAGIFFSCNVAFSSMPVFLPTIVSTMGFSRLASQALSAPPFLLAFFAVLATAYVSDRKQSRSMPVFFSATIAALGYLSLAVAGLLQTGFLLRYLAVFAVCAGFFSCVVITITWTVNNQASEEGTGMAVLNIIGQSGPLLGTRLYPDSEAPYFVKGMSVCAGFMAIAAVLGLVLRWVLTARNRRRSCEFVYIT